MSWRGHQLLHLLEAFGRQGEVALLQLGDPGEKCRVQVRPLHVYGESGARFAGVKFGRLEKAFGLQ